MLSKPKPAACVHGRAAVQRAVLALALAPYLHWRTIPELARARSTAVTP